MLGDINKELPITRLVVCKPNREPLCELAQFFDYEIIRTFNGVDEISFSITKNNVNSKYIKGGYLIELNEEDYFIIQNPVYVEGKETIIKIKAWSQTHELAYKDIKFLEGTYKLHNPVSHDGILDYLITLCPSWKVGEIDSSLLTKYRTFSVAEQSVLNFLLENLQRSYECVFVFDTMDKTISAKTVDNLGVNNGLFLCEHNLLNNLQKEELTNEIVTRLYVYGSDNVSINEVNPTGVNYIEDFSYYKNSDWMSQELIFALDKYEDLIKSKEGAYTWFLDVLNGKMGEKLELEIKLSSLNVELDGLQRLLDLAMTNGDDFSKEKEFVDEKKEEINEVVGLIKLVQSQIDNVLNDIKELKCLLAVENNFTIEQLEELDLYVKEASFRDDSYRVFDSMTYDEQLQVKKDLMQRASNELNSVKQPRVLLKLEVDDFLSDINYANSWEKLKLGDIVNVECKDGTVIEIRLLRYVHKVGELTLEFSNKFNITDATYQFRKIMEQSISTATKLKYEQYKYKKYVDSGMDNEVTRFINSELDASKNAVISSVNQDVKIDKHGIWLRQSDEDGNFLPKQMRIINDKIVISNDDWKSAKTAISGDGVVADTLVGRLLLGNDLRIDTDNGKFTVNNEGDVTLQDLDMTVTSDKSKVVINPNDGLKISRKDGEVWKDVLVADEYGTLKAHDMKTYNLSIESGVIKDGNGNVIIDAKTSELFLNALSKVYGQLSCRNLDIKDGNFKVYDKYGNLTFWIDENGNVTLGNGVISWGDISGRPSLIDSGDVTRITRNEISTATINANQINTGVLDGFILKGSRIEGSNIYGGKFYDDDGNCYLEIESNYSTLANMILRSATGKKVFKINDTTNGFELISYEDVVFYTIHDKVYPCGEWNFLGGLKKNSQSLATENFVQDYAVKDHSHQGIKLQVYGGRLEYYNGNKWTAIANLNDL